MVNEVKNRRIKAKDWDAVEKFVKDTYNERKTSTFRTNHERKWKEVDRQIEMEPMQRVDEAGKEKKADWHNVLELGELTKASEVITSDIMRIIFPVGHFWLQPHVKLEWPTDEKTGKPKTDTEKQKIVDGLLRSLMGQQHQDFGLKARFRLSIKEALHHGSFVAEANFARELMIKEDGKVRQIGAPVWQPFSMWNCYPDPSPAVVTTNMFYGGSMITVEYPRLAALKRMATGKGWMQDRLKKVEETSIKQGKVETKGIELVKYSGDITIERADGDIFLPNSVVKLANGHIVYYDPNELPYSNVIYSGYERQDIRDPYYTSPIIKQSPMQKFASIMTNRFADAVDLKTEPPLEYDGNDPEYVANDGPTIAPGAKTATKSMGQGHKVIEIGDPKPALEAMQFALNHLQQGTGVNALRSGMTNSDRQTATEVNKVAQGAEVRTIEFIAQLEPALRSFLYMQHELNRMHMDDYPFYNEEMHTPDFIVAKKKDIQADCHFEIVGSRGLLGEEQRTQKVTAVTAFASGNPLFASLLRPTELLLSMYRDAGEKNPQNFVKVDQQAPPELMQAKQALQQLQQENAQLKQGAQVDMEKINKDYEAKMAAIRADIALGMAKIDEQRKTAGDSLVMQLKEIAAEMDRTHQMNMQEMRHQGEKQAMKNADGTDKPNPIDSVVERLDRAEQAIADNHGKVIAEISKKKKRKVTTPDGRVYTSQEVD